MGDNLGTTKPSHKRRTTLWDSRRIVLDRNFIRPFAQTKTASNRERRRRRLRDELGRTQRELSRETAASASAKGHTDLQPVRPASSDGLELLQAAPGGVHEWLEIAA